MRETVERIQKSEAQQLRLQQQKVSEAVDKANKGKAPAQLDANASPTSSSAATAVDPLARLKADQSSQDSPASPGTPPRKKKVSRRHSTADMSRVPDLSSLMSSRKGGIASVDQDDDMYEASKGLSTLKLGNDIDLLLDSEGGTGAGAGADKAVLRPKTATASLGKSRRSSFQEVPTNAL